MSKYTEDTEITFYASIGFARAVKEETSTLVQLGLSQEEIDEMTDEEVEEFIQESYDAFLGNNLDAGWYVEGDN